MQPYLILRISDGALQHRHHHHQHPYTLIIDGDDEIVEDMAEITESIRNYITRNFNVEKMRGKYK